MPGAAIAEAVAERTEVALAERNQPEPLDPDADERGRHTAHGHDGEVKVPVDGHAGEGRHEANGPDGEVRVPTAEADGARHGPARPAARAGRPGPTRPRSRSAAARPPAPEPDPTAPPRSPHRSGAALCRRYDAARRLRPPG